MADILKLISGTDRYNLHSHTEFCDGRAQMEAFARRVLEEGMDVYGFSPHSPVPIVSPCNMLKSNVSSYLAEVDRIKATYGDRCHFLAGMEIDYLGDDWGPSNEYFNTIPLDYRIGSVHFLPTAGGELVDCDGRHESFVEKMHRYFNDDIRYVVETFYVNSIKMVQAGGFDIVGHLDKIADNASYFCPGIEEEPWYRSLVDNYIDEIISGNFIVEINTKVYADRKRLFPSPRYWKQLSDAAVPMIVNSDAHVPALINASRNEAIELLMKLTNGNV